LKISSRGSSQEWFLLDQGLHFSFKATTASWVSAFTKPFSEYIERSLVLARGRTGELSLGSVEQALYDCLPLRPSRVSDHPIPEHLATKS
jgi:hypothetical protein